MGVTRYTFCLVVLSRTLAAQEHNMKMADTTGWQTAVGATVFLQYVHTSGTRGAYQLGSVNRAMFEGAGPWAGGMLHVRAMGSAEPLTLTDRGQPQLLQVAFALQNGQTITDRAHPSLWIMELAASYEHALSMGTAVFAYAAPIGEPALGPPAYVHRASADANPAAPLSHHAQDLTHSSFGVLTVGLGVHPVRLELSAFNDREPEEPSPVFYYRGARLDSRSARVTWMAGKGWSVDWSYGYLPAASGGHAHGTLHRMTAAVVRDAAPWFVTIAYGANDPVGPEQPARTVLAEGERRWSNGDALFGRAEYVQRTPAELSLVGSVDGRQDIESLQLGYSRRLASWLGGRISVGGYATTTLLPPRLEPFYGGRTPSTIAGFGQLSW